MPKITFNVVRRPNGYFVIGVSPMGPFASLERALDLARSMVAELQAGGHEADLAMRADADA